jgi:ribosomal-protein-alanine N-acetyltransferase
MVKPEPTWETRRLLARPAGAGDAAVVFEHYASDAVVAKYMTWRPHRNLAETIEFLGRCEQVWADGSAFPWSLWLRDSGEFAGLVEIRVRGSAVDVGYALSRRCWGHGLMSEALASIVRWGLAQPEIFRVWATCDVDNVASARVLEPSWDGAGRRTPPMVGAPESQ